LNNFLFSALCVDVSFATDQLTESYDVQVIEALFDLTGRQLMEMDYSSVKGKINISSLNSGLYFIVIENNGKKNRK